MAWQHNAIFQHCTMGNNIATTIWLGASLGGGHRGELSGGLREDQQLHPGWCDSSAVFPSL